MPGLSAKRKNLVVLRPGPEWGDCRREAAEWLRNESRLGAWPSAMASDGRPRWMGHSAVRLEAQHKEWLVAVNLYLVQVAGVEEECIKKQLYRGMEPRLKWTRVGDKEPKWQTPEVQQQVVRWTALVNLLEEAMILKMRKNGSQHAEAVREAVRNFQAPSGGWPEEGPIEGKSWGRWRHTAAWKKSDRGKCLSKQSN